VPALQVVQADSQSIRRQLVYFQLLTIFSFGVERAILAPVPSLAPFWLEPFCRPAPTMFAEPQNPTPREKSKAPPGRNLRDKGGAHILSDAELTDDWTDD